MPDPLIQPALAFNFWVLLWEVQGPGLFGLQPRNAGERFALGLASGLLSAASQALFGAFSDATGLNSNLEVETYQEGGKREGQVKDDQGSDDEIESFDRIALTGCHRPRSSPTDVHVRPRVIEAISCK